jgi:hypothetical protein
VLGWAPAGHATARTKLRAPLRWGFSFGAQGRGRQLRRALHAFDDNAFRVLALRAFEGPEIEPRPTWLNLRKIHLHGAFWAPRAIIYVRALRRVFEWWHVQLPLLQAGVLPNSQPPTPGTKAAVDDKQDRAPIVNK